MSADASAGRDLGGVWLLVVYLIGWIGVLVIVNAVGIGLLFGLGFAAPQASGVDLMGMVESVQAGETPSLPGWFFAVSLWIQFPLMVALVPVTTKVVDRLWYARREPQHARTPWRRVLGTHRAPAWTLALAALMGLTTGLLPGWIASRLRDLVPGLDSGALEMIHDAITTGPVYWQVPVILGIVLGAGVAEELVFRGFMWDALRRVAPLPVVWVGTSLIFAFYHMDPVQSFALIFTSLVLGWIRWTSGSVVPGIALHMVNNGLGVTVALLGVDTDASLALSLLGALVSLLGAGAFLWGRRLHGRTLRTDQPLSRAARGG